MVIAYNREVQPLLYIKEFQHVPFIPKSFVYNFFFLMWWQYHACMYLRTATSSRLNK